MQVKPRPLPSRLGLNRAIRKYRQRLGVSRKWTGLDIERFRQAKGISDRGYVEAPQYSIEEWDQQLLNYAFLLRHSMAELATASRSGLMHDHSEARTRITDNVDYKRYLMGHHQGQPGASPPDHQ